MSCISCGCFAHECACPQTASSYSVEGWPLDEDGIVLTHLMTPAQRSELNKLVTIQLANDTKEKTK